MKLMIFLENDASGKLDQYATEVADEDDITEAVKDAIDEQNWTLRPGDTIAIVHIED